MAALVRWPLMQNAISSDDKLCLVQFILATDKFTNGPKVLEVRSFHS
jgi:hypothetical protein